MVANKLELGGVKLRRKKYVVLSGALRHRASAPVVVLKEASAKFDGARRGLLAQIVLLAATFSVLVVSA